MSVHKLILSLAILLGMVTSALADPPLDPVLLQRIIGSMQAQRNQALDALAVSEARLVAMTADLTKAQERLKELEPKSSESDNK